MSELRLLVGTRKGAWIISSDGARSKWHIEGPMHLGAVVSHYVADPRKHGGQACGVLFSRWRRQFCAPRSRFSCAAGVVDREATEHGRR